MQKPFLNNCQRSWLAVFATPTLATCMNTACNGFSKCLGSVARRLGCIRRGVHKLYLVPQQDTPAIACQEDVERTASLLRQRMDAYYEAVQSSARKTAMASTADVRVDVCLYLIEPHQLLEVDIEAMKSVGRFTPVVPLIAKVRNPGIYLTLHIEL